MLAASKEVVEPCAPRWLFFTFAIGLFVYQSLDAIDGKQARRTGTSGPLGELFDHGCDALNTTVSSFPREKEDGADRDALRSSRSS